MLIRKSRLMGVMLALALFPSLQAQQLTPDQQKIQELERKIEELDRRLSAAEAKSAGAPAPATFPAVAPPVIAPAPAPLVQTGSQRPSNAGVAAGTIPPAEANAVGLVT